MYRLLASLAPACNDTFTTLLLPAAISIDPARGLLVLPHYDGEDLAARWNESDGGARLGPSLATTIPAVLDDHQHTSMIVNNGDFYPRNLIVQPNGRIVIVDWETCNPHSPFHTVDHPENVAAVFYVHMWGNPAWQAAYRDALHQRFVFSQISFAKGVVIQALELANMWMNDTDMHLAAIQASIITGMLAKSPDR